MNVNLTDQLLKLSINFLRVPKINEEIFDNLEYFYSENDRHEYSQISQIVFNHDDEQNEAMDYNLTKIIELAEEKNSLHIKKYKKLYDHLRLGISQKKYIEDKLRVVEYELIHTKNEVAVSISDSQNIINEIALEVSQAKETIEEVSESVTSAEDKMKEIEEHSKKITTDFVSILGIFSAVIFAAFGGLEILKNVLGNIEKVQTGKLLVFSSLSTGAIVFLVFLLLNGISKLTDLNLRSCGCQPDKTCKCNLVQKHPSLVIIYIILFLLTFIGLTEYVLDYKSLFSDVMSTWTSLLKLIIVLLTTGAFIISSIAWFIRKKQMPN